MSPEFSSHCFELFVQAERITERAAGGLGIGLAEDRAALATITEADSNRVVCTVSRAQARHAASGRVGRTPVHTPPLWAHGMLGQPPGLGG
jgi:hypothetical protein